MELVKTILRLDLSEAFNPWTELRGMIRELGEQPKAEIQASPFTIDLKGKRQRLVLRVRTMEFEHEWASSIEESSAAALDKMVQSNKISKFPEIVGVSHEAMFMEPYALPFHELLILVKNRFLKVSELADASTDVGIIFDQAEGDVVKHYQFGPMGKEQLQSAFLNWSRDGIADNFIFLILGYKQNKAFKFENEYLKRFLVTANEWEVSQAEWLFRYLKEKGD
jgi:hypothetical protein